MKKILSSTSQAEGIRPPKILIVDDKVENLIALEKTLAGLDAEIVRAQSGNEALAYLLEHNFALILLDVQMPVMDGFETAELIRNNKDTKHIPILFVTAISKDQKHIFKGYASGAVDYLFKPLDPDILQSKVGVFLDLYHHKAMIEKANAELQVANQKIISQQKSAIKEERLKLLMQMAGGMAHELNQPLMGLMGNIELIEFYEDEPSQWKQRLDNIKTAGQRISDIVKRIQEIRHDNVRPYPGGRTILNLDQTINLLAVEDSDADFEILHSLLQENNQIRVTRAETISEGIWLAKEKNVDIILMDHILPDGNGLDFLSQMMTSKIVKPVIAITGHGNEIVASKLIKAGAADYLSKIGINQALLLRSITNAIEKFKLNKEIAQANQKMAEMATCDGLTGLYNRHQMNTVLSQEFNRAGRYDDDLACMLLDLDYFKEVNDTLGHGFGDFVLQQFGARLLENVRQSDTCFRYGGEEFMILLPQTDIQGAKKMAEKVRYLCECTPYNNGEDKKTVTVSIGVTSLKHQQAAQPEDLLAKADRALYQAKAEGRNRIKIYLEGWVHKEANAIDFMLLRNRLEAVLEKTKKASVEALELLVRDAGGARFKNHSRRVLHCLELIGAKLDLPPVIVQTLQRAAALHDCTKVLLSQTMMDKKERLTESESDQIKDHPFMIAELIESFDFFTNERTALLYHHEHFNGSGYPDGLKGTEIPLAARILSITDAFVAMTSPRNYRKKMSGREVVKELTDNAGLQFDPGLVEHFLDVILENSLLEVPAETISTSKKIIAEKKK